MKRFYLGLLGLLLFTSCINRDKKVPLFLYNESDPFINEMARHIRWEAIGSFEITTIDSKNFQIIQNENIEDRINAGDDLFLINPVDRLGVYPIIKKLKSNNTPVIFFNREPLKKDLELWDRAYYVGTIGEQSALLQAELIMDIFGGDPNILNDRDLDSDGVIDAIILKGEQGHQDAEIRTSRVVEALKNSGYNLDIITTEVANWDRYEAQIKMNQIINEYTGKFELIISNNDAMALGAITALLKRGYFHDLNNNNVIERNFEKWFPVVGIDGIKEAVEQIEKGYLYGTVHNDAELQAKAIKELADFILKNRDLNELSFELIDDRYIMLDYKKLQ